MSTIMSFKTKEEKEKNLLSGPITPADFDAGAAAYDISPDRIILPNGQTLTGLSLDKPDILNLLSNPNVTHIYLRFIISPLDNYITLAAGGFIPTGPQSGECHKNNLYDYCEPCPPYCASFV